MVTSAAPDGAYDADVAVVGFGPVGVCAANLLGGMGVATVVFERDRAVYPRARAVTVNDWTMRIFQSMGLDEQMYEVMEANSHLNWKTYGGRTVFRMLPEGVGIGHPGSMMIYQPEMERVLRAGAARYPSVDVRFGQSVTAVEQDDDGVTVAVTNAGGGLQHTVRARYLLACDGGSSSVRSSLGIRLEGSTHEQRWIVIDGEMRRWWPDCKELVFWSDPDRPVVDIPLAMGYHRWEIPLRAGETDADFDTDEKLWALLTPLGVSPENVTLRQHAFYVHHVRHAERWRLGRVLLLGDAAHLMPPWAGQGMQSGIRDAQNVAWKLREVLAGRLDDGILATYESERAPHVAEVTELSQKLGVLIAGRDPRFIFLRNHLGPVLMRMPGLVRRLLPSTTPAVGVGWLRGTPAKGSAVGRMLPQPAVSDARGARIRLDDALGEGFAVVGAGCDPRTVLSAGQVAQWSALGARFLAVRQPDDGAHDDSDVMDHTGALGAWFGRYRVRVAAVRPDRFVAATDGTGLDLPSPLASPTPALATAAQ